MILNLYAIQELFSLKTGKRVAILWKVKWKYHISYNLFRFLQGSNIYKLWENYSQIRCLSIDLARPDVILPVVREITHIKAYNSRISKLFEFTYSNCNVCIIDWLRNIVLRLFINWHQKIESKLPVAVENIENHHWKSSSRTKNVYDKFIHTQIILSWRYLNDYWNMSGFLSSCYRFA